jgi:hypothetical protein
LGGSSSLQAAELLRKIKAAGAPGLDFETGDSTTFKIKWFVSGRDFSRAGNS